MNESAKSAETSDIRHAQDAYVEEDTQYRDNMYPIQPTMEEIIGKAIIHQCFTKVRLNEKQAGHNLWANEKEVHYPPDMDNGESIASLRVLGTNSTTTKP
eukprot:3076865-Amphidinium_carterae.2